MAVLSTGGQSGYITPGVLGVPNAQRGDKNLKWLNGPHVCKVATSPLPSWGSSTLSAGKKLAMAMRPTCGQSGFITLAVLGIPNTQRGNKN